MVRIGEGGKYLNTAKKNGFIAVGWEELGDIRKLGGIEAIREALRKAYPKVSVATLGNYVGQLHRFAFLIQEGDLILSPAGEGNYYVGRVGRYYYEPSPHDGCPYRHRREIEWLNIPVNKQAMSANLAYSLGAMLTVFSLNKYSDELDDILHGQKHTPAEPLTIRNAVLQGLMELGGRQFERFVADLLRTMGFTAEMTQYVGDKGIDVTGVLEVGLAQITMRVQVKRVRPTIGNKEVLAMRGTLGQGEQGCIITTSTFSSQAIQEAEAQGKQPIQLIDGTDLSNLIFKHFDFLSKEYQQLFGIQRKQSIDLEAQYEFVAYDEPQAEELTTPSTIVKSEWDTLVCPAQPEGFQYAFIEQGAWWAVRISAEKLPLIKFVAIYQVAPISAITYIAKIDKIEPYENTSKFKLWLMPNSIEELAQPITLGESPNLRPQGPKYAQLKKIRTARTLDELWG